MQPGGALVQDNWAPTMRGVKLRGGYVRWCDLYGFPPWANSHPAVGDNAIDVVDNTNWKGCGRAHPAQRIHRYVRGRSRRAHGTSAGLRR